MGPRMVMGATPRPTMGRGVLASLGSGAFYYENASNAIRMSDMFIARLDKADHSRTETALLLNPGFSIVNLLMIRISSDVRLHI